MRTLTRYFLVTCLVAIVFAATPVVSWGQTTPSPAQTGDEGLAAPSLTFQPVIGFRSINQATSTIVALVFLGGALLAFYYLIRGAYRYVTAGDNAGNTEQARSTIQNAVIGLVLLGTIYVIFRFAVNLIPGLGTFFS